METEKREDLIIETINTNGMPVKSVYRYIKPEDFIWKQQRISEKILLKLKPALLNAQGELKNFYDEKGRLKKDLNEKDMKTIIEQSSNVDGVDIDFVEIIALHYVKSSSSYFKESEYYELIESMNNMKASKIRDLEDCLPDFYSTIIPFVMKSILISFQKKKILPVKVTKDKESKKGNLEK